MISSRAAELEWWSDDAEAASGTTRAKPRVRMKEDTMVPLFDLANHKRPRDTIVSSFIRTRGLALVVPLAASASSLHHSSSAARLLIIPKAQCISGAVGTRRA
jgi:hypothetical protein